jgi:carbon starvation protein
LQDALVHVWKPLGEVRSLPANLLASGLVVSAWGYFLVAAVLDPDSGIKALWPIFGIANQLLAATALCLATTVILKMALGAPISDPAQSSTPARAGSETGAPLRSPALALVTLVPLLWLLTVTGTAAVQKIGNDDPKIGFLAAAHVQEKAIEAAHVRVVESSTEETRAAAARDMKKAIRLTFNFYLDAAVTAFFLTLVVGIFLISLREWVLLLARKKLAQLRETAPVWLPDYALAQERPLHIFSLLALLLGLAKELSGEAAVERARQSAAVCECEAARHQRDAGQAYVAVAERRYQGVNRCC